MMREVCFLNLPRYFHRMYPDLTRSIGF
jgi:hypothetical protein